MKKALDSPLSRALKAFIVLLFTPLAATAAAGLYVATTGRVSNEAWIAIGTAAYATFTFFTFVVLLAAAWYAGQQVESVQRRMRLDALDRLSSQWDSRLVRQGRKLANKADEPKTLVADLEVYELQNSDEFYALSALANLIEEMGLLVKDRRSYLDLADVADRFRPSIVHYGYLFSEYIERGREQNKDHLVNFRQLAAAMAFASMTRRSA